jgi:hypothetical protein
MPSVRFVETFCYERISLTPAVTPGPGTNTVEGFLEALKKADDEKFELIEPPAPLNKAWDDAKTLRSLDMLMGGWFNARERTEGQFASIADAAGLKIHKVYPTRACHWYVCSRLAFLRSREAGSPNTARNKRVFLFFFPA